MNNGVASAARAAGAAVLAAILLAASPALASNRHSHQHKPSQQSPGSGGIGLDAGPTVPGGVGGVGGVGAGGTGKLPGDSTHLGDRILHPGMSGHDVRVLQEYLTIAGYPAAITGTFDTPTVNAVNAFRVAQGLHPTGIVGLRLEKLLRGVIAAIDAVPAVGKTRINGDGTATGPVGVPAIVQQMVAAANRIIDKPYIYGGGHGTWNDSGYDCSGAVSYVLHAAGLLTAPEDSTELESYGSPGPGKWVTIYANAGHTWIVIAGRAFDTANFGGPNVPSGSGPRWRSDPTGNLADGGNYVARHPSGL